jgi:hypothetical protein
MSDEGFLRRWARRKSELRTAGREGRELPPEPVVTLDATPTGSADAAVAVADAAPLPPAEPATERPLPTMDDVANLHAESDFSAFVARGVDQAVRRTALKKLFADPRFNVMDRLDVYIDDYTQPSPMSETMLASLEHAKSMFMKLVEEEPEAPEAELKAAPQTQQPPEQETQ